MISDCFLTGILEFYGFTSEAFAGKDTRGSFGAFGACVFGHHFGLLLKKHNVWIIPVVVSV